MPGNDVREPLRREIRESRNQIAPKMPFEKAERYVNQTGQYGNPGSFEMEITTPAVFVRKHVAVAARDRGPRGRNRQAEQRTSIDVSGFTPIKTGVRDENFRPADEQGHEG